MTDVQTDAKNARQIVRCRDVPSSQGRRKVAGNEHKKEKVYIQSRNVYENKQKDDNLSAQKGESFA
jgi:hypothetical protein